MRPAVEALLTLARTLPIEHLATFMGEIEIVRVTALARLSTPAPTASADDRLIDVKEAAARLGISESFLYRTYQNFPFARRAGRKLLFSTEGIEKHIRQGSVDGVRGTLARRKPHWNTRSPGDRVSGGNRETT